MAAAAMPRETWPRGFRPFPVTYSHWPACGRKSRQEFKVTGLRTWEQFAAPDEDVHNDLSESSLRLGPRLPRGASRRRPAACRVGR
eukprot:6752977-Prymnesium_polylepis.1